MNTLEFALMDMLLGMLLGMIASPIVMKSIKHIRQRHKVNRLLREAAAQKEKIGSNYSDDQTYKIL